MHLRFSIRGRGAIGGTVKATQSDWYTHFCAECFSNMTIRYQEKIKILSLQNYIQKIEHMDQIEKRETYERNESVLNNLT